MRCPSGQARNYSVQYIWDFMSLTALFPRCWAAPAFDTGTEPVLQNISAYPADYRRWTSPQLKNGYGQLNFRTIITVLTYNYGRVETTVQTTFPWWLNPMNPTPGNSAHFTLPDYTTSYVAPATYDRTQDLRLTGCPANPETLTESWSNGVALVLVGGDGTYPSYYVAPNGKFYTNDGPGFQPSQDAQPPPVVTQTSCEQFFDDGSENGALDGSAPNPGHAIHARVIDQLTTVTNGVDPEAACQALMTSAPALSPKTNFLGREGNLYFDYFGVSSIYPDLTNYAAGNMYALNGKATITVPANTLLGVQPGVNEGASPLPATSPGFYNGAGSPAFAYYFDAGLVAAPLTSPVKVPDWAGGVNAFNGLGGSYPDCSTFCSSGIHVQLSGGGWPGLTQWSAGSTPSPGDIITNVNDGSSTFAFYKLQCTVAGTGGGSEPNWSSLSVGGTITDGGVTWMLLAKGAPVTARVTNTHANRVMIFPLNTGNIATAEESLVPLYPAQNNDPNNDAGSSPTGFPGFVCQSSLLRVPKNPMTVTQDVALFNDINVGGYFPNLQLNISMALELDANYLPDYYHFGATALFEIMNTGETYVTYEQVDAFSPTSMGWVYLGQPGDINYNPGSTGAGNGGGINNIAGAGGSNQDTGGL